MDAYHVVLYVHLLALFVGIGAALGAAHLPLPAPRRAHARAGRAVGDGGRQGGEALPGRDPRPLRDGRLHDVARRPSRGRGARAGSTSGSPLSSCSTCRGRASPSARAQKLQAAMMANGPGPLGPEARRMALHPGLWVVEFSNIGIVLGVVWNMTEKPGLGRVDRRGARRLRGRRGLALLFSRAPQDDLCRGHRTCRLTVSLAYYPKRVRARDTSSAHCGGRCGPARASLRDVVLSRTTFEAARPDPGQPRRAAVWSTTSSTGGLFAAICEAQLAAARRRQELLRSSTLRPLGSTSRSSIPRRSASRSTADSRADVGRRLLAPHADRSVLAITRA